ncbi:heme A synthase [Streptomyces sp. JJ36]|uniref:COX15/CtaA family protein n=1 Tax=Streptomyces sp. JJ36 TaxID=2736645 RepID=UPI001F030B8A|nr:COX15/CtaA family protein [Streptomyces sp. JJ36]MCF6523375.1 heme A synthase [Streptomyces sp. JJ36]
MPNILPLLRNPLAYVAARWTPGRRTLQRATLSAVVMSVLIVVTGGAVRLTGSGLGCETWPKCSSDSLTATPEMGLHGYIEFGNRMLTYVLCAAVGWAIVAARAAKPVRRGLRRLAWSQFWLVMGNAVLGGVTVLTELNPYTVAAHFLLATGLVTVTTVTWLRAREGDGPPRPLVGRPVKRLAGALTVVTVALLVAGTVVTGSGPHAGDSSDVPRMPVEWRTVAQLHAELAWAVVVLTVAVWLVLRVFDAPPGPRARARELLLVLLAQGALGYVQYLTELPEVLVGLHLLGSVLVWIAVLRLLLSLRERGLPPTAPVPAPASAEEQPLAVSGR